MLPLVLVISGLLGLAVGSFVNVVIYRVPRAISLLSPGSACPNCGNRILWHQNIPLLSWVLLAGKCANCKTKISLGYPIVEAATSLSFVGISAWAFGITNFNNFSSVISGTLVFVAWSWFVAAGLALAVIDFEFGILPNQIVLWLYAVGTISLAILAFQAGDFAAFTRGVIGGASLLSFYLLVKLIAPRGLGLGDVKLAGILGFYSAWLGWGAFALGALGAFALGATFGLFLIARGTASRRSALPFGPWMFLGSVIGAIFGNWLWGQYLLFVAHALV
jgi:leader peptidase (prepilin peptidase)/N-methyltransferase